MRLEGCTNCVHPWSRSHIKISRDWAMPSAWTFTIPPIQILLKQYVGDGKNWIDPYAGKNSPAEITNDHNPDTPAKYHLDALDFANMLEGEYDGVLFDPPYSCRQVSENYKLLGKKPTQLDTSANFYTRVINPLAGKIKLGGYAISFGWNTTGFGKKRGFKIVEILIVAHGGRHNDTLVTVEKKVSL